MSGAATASVMEMPRGGAGGSIARWGWSIVWPFLIAAVVGYALQTRVTGFAGSLLIDCGIAIVMAVSLTVVNGFAGQFSLGHAGFLAVGGYFAAGLVYYGTYKFFGDTGMPANHGGVLSTTPQNAAETVALGLSHWRDFFGRGDLLFVASALCGAILATAVGWLVGLPSLRLRGDYLAIVTLGFGEIVRVLIQGTPEQLDPTSDPSVTAASLYREMGITVVNTGQGYAVELPHFGGALGFSGAPPYTTVFWSVGAALLTLILTVRLKYSSYGRALLSIREDEIAAQAMGINTTRYKVRAFMYGAFFAGIGGALYAMKVGSINAGELGFQKSFDFIIMVVLGGLGSVSGAALAAVILTLLPELLRDPTGASIFPWGIVGAVVILALMQFAMLARHRRRFPLRGAITLAVILGLWQLLRAAHMTGFKIRGVPFNLGEYRMVIYSLALIIIMIARPSGFFGVHEIWDYVPRGWQFWRARVEREAA